MPIEMVNDSEVVDCEYRCSGVLVSSDDLENDLSWNITSARIEKKVWNGENLNEKSFWNGERV
jgi:hypothetical protein